MCGVAVLLELEGRPIEPATLDRMSAAVAHRGPDDAGRFIDGAVGFGFRRLAILDLTPAGHQPMKSEDGTAVLAFNGQIFNYVELRDELRALGHRFRSTGDTEVLLRAYLQWGTGCLPRLNGDWAFVIFDRRTRTLFGARDRFGVKPLFRFAGAGCMAWASEIKSLLTLSRYQPSISWPAADAYLRDGRMDEPDETFFDGIRSIPAAHAFVVDEAGRERTWRYWSLPDADDADTALADPAAAFATLFEDAVRIRLRSDVPVGICLSGGLDSTAVACAMYRAQKAATSGQRVQAFLYHHPDYDERRYVAATVAQTSAQLHTLELDYADLWALADPVVRAHDAPVQSLTGMVGYELMRTISDAGIRVVLNGQGADETLAGYDSFFLDAWYTDVRSGRPFRAWREMRDCAGGRTGPALRLAAKTMRRVVQTELRRLPAYRALAHTRHDRRDRRESWFVPLPTEPTGNGAPFRRLDLDNALRQATTVFPLPLYLRVEDRNSMAHSVEVRLPFLDHRVVELVFRTSHAHRIRGRWSKHLLREAMRERIPETVRTRVDKMGFPSPTASLLRGKTFDQLFAIISTRKAKERGVYAWDRMTRALVANRDRDNPTLAWQFFRVAQFELWAAIHGLCTLLYDWAPVAETCASCI